MKKKRRSRDVSPAEPEWVEWGGERMLVMGYTEGGAPYGLTEEEMRDLDEIDLSRRQRRHRSDVRMNWADAKAVLRALLDSWGERPERDAIGFIRRVGEGLSSRVFATTIRRFSGREESVVVKLPAPNADSDRDEQLMREATVLRHLAGQPLPFKIPRPIGEIEVDAGLATVQEMMDGDPFDMRHGVVETPWDLVARVAAAIHAIEPTAIHALIGGHATRRDHAAAHASLLGELSEPEARDTEVWVREHLPPATPSSLIHGDLLDQNILHDWENGQIAVVDWGDVMIGDPALDLAIVTRGVKKPFRDTHGRRRLLDAYNRLATTPLLLAAVHLHELIMAADWYRLACRDYGRRSPHAEEHRSFWRSTLKRASQGTE